MIQKTKQHTSNPSMHFKWTDSLQTEHSIRCDDNKSIRTAYKYLYVNHQCLNKHVICMYVRTYLFVWSAATTWSILSRSILPNALRGSTSRSMIRLIFSADIIRTTRSVSNHSLNNSSHNIHCYKIKLPLLFRAGSSDVVGTFGCFYTKCMFLATTINEVNDLW